MAKVAEWGLGWACPTPEPTEGCHGAQGVGGQPAHPRPLDDFLGKHKQKAKAARQPPWVCGAPETLPVLWLGGWWAQWFQDPEGCPPYHASSCQAQRLGCHHECAHTVHHVTSPSPPCWVPRLPPQAATPRPTCSARNRAFNQYTRTTNSSHPSSNRSRWDEANDSCRRSPRKWAPGKSGPNLPFTTPAGQFRGDTENRQAGRSQPREWGPDALLLPEALSPRSPMAPSGQCQSQTGPIGMQKPWSSRTSTSRLS